ncbi:response regulator [Flavobacterium silvaticum]|uniref:Response regulator transcription factor n=1 Tax=Flavobacterium silvaticum TaxID=1852020 RepID=A0A972FTE9_9FLAO|nr:response regulator [Flavobacterium silvaticum]NMH27667.1 response regulator transcription factor [Flavobacterium silvaticum]
MINLLIIEDHFGMMHGYKAILSKEFELNISWASCLKEALLLVQNTNQHFDVIILDIMLPSEGKSNVKIGQEIGKEIIKNRIGSKIMVITSCVETLLIQAIIKDINPICFLNKADFDDQQLIVAFKSALTNKKYFTNSIIKAHDNIVNQKLYLDSTNQKIIILLNEGIKTKNLPNYLNLSLTAIDKRKAIIKEFFNISKGTDEDILFEARSKGYI